MPLFTIKEWKATTLKARSKTEAERKACREFDGDGEDDYDEGLDVTEVKD